MKEDKGTGVVQTRQAWWCLTCTRLILRTHCVFLVSVSFFFSSSRPRRPQRFPSPQKILWTPTTITTTRSAPMLPSTTTRLSRTSSMQPWAIRTRRCPRIRSRSSSRRVRAACPCAASCLSDLVLTFLFPLFRPARPPAAVPPRHHPHSLPPVPAEPRVRLPPEPPACSRLPPPSSLASPSVAGHVRPPLPPALRLRYLRRRHLPGLQQQRPQLALLLPRKQPRPARPRPLQPHPVPH